MFGRSARSTGNFSLELAQDLVLPNVGQVDFHDFRKYWNFNVLEMALKTFRFVQGLHITPLFFFFDTSKPGFLNLFVKVGTSGNLKMSKFGKDARRKIIKICPIKRASTSVVR